MIKIAVAEVSGITHNYSIKIGTLTFEKSAVSLTNYVSWFNTTYGASYEIDLFSEEFVVLKRKTGTATLNVVITDGRTRNEMGFPSGIRQLTTEGLRGTNWGLVRFVLECGDIGTDAGMIVPYQHKGGVTLDGRSFRTKTQLSLTKWNCKTQYLNIRQAKDTLKFFEYLGSNVQVNITSEAYLDYGDSFVSGPSFQMIAEEEYLKSSGSNGFYEVEFMIIEGSA